MKTQDKATPRPWEADGPMVTKDGWPLKIDSGYNEGSFESGEWLEIGKANARLIVEAVNNYETLKAQKKDLLDSARHIWICPAFKEKSPCPDCDRSNELIEESHA